MAVHGDHSVAVLLSALAEAPDFAAVASFLLTQLAELTAALRALMLRIDEPQENLAVVATTGPDTPPAVHIPIGDLSSPLIISALSLTPARGDDPLPQRSLASIVPWVAVPMSQPRFRGAPETMGPQRPQEQIASPAMEFFQTGEHRLGVAPAGVILLQGPIDQALIEEAAD